MNRDYHQVKVKMSQLAAKCSAEYDIVIVADFGHGAINSNMIDILAKKAKFLAINTQANAGNRDSIRFLDIHMRIIFVSLSMR